MCPALPNLLWDAGHSSYDGHNGRCCGCCGVCCAGCCFYLCNWWCCGIVYSNNEFIICVDSVETNRIGYKKNENTWENGLPDSSVVKSKLPDRVGRGFDSRSVIHFPTH
eukprot:Pgem_evm2s2971